MDEIQMLYDQLIDRIKAYHPTNDLSKLKKHTSLPVRPMTDS